MELVVATNNKAKLAEIKESLADLDISIVTYPFQIKERGKTYRENALLKARKLARLSGKITLADDSGLEIEALKGEPGIFSARYLGERLSAAERNEQILKLLKNVSPEKRKAVFRCVLALAFSPEKIICREGVCEGEITYAPRGEKSFGYDPIFLIPESGKTFAELSREEKNRISHRGIALQKIKEVLIGSWQL